MSSLDLTAIDSIDKLNELLLKFIEEKYHRSPHSSLDGISPIDRYMADQALIRFPACSTAVEDAFLVCAKRKVKGDATVSVDNIAFEVPQKFIGQSITLRYDPETLGYVYILSDDRSDPVRAYPVRPQDNALIPRVQNRRALIDYRKLYSGGNDGV